MVVVVWRVGMVWIGEVFGVRRFDVVVVLVGVCVVWGLKKSGMDDFRVVE